MADGGWRNVPCPAIPIHPLRGGERQQPEGLGSLKTPRWTTRKKETKRERKRESREECTELSCTLTYLRGVAPSFTLLLLLLLSYLLRPSVPLSTSFLPFLSLSSLPPFFLPSFGFSPPRGEDEIVSRGNTRRTGRLDASL